MFTVRMDAPFIPQMEFSLNYQLKNKAAFLKNWAQTIAMEARNNARAKGGRRWWKELARSLQVRQVTEDSIEVGTDYRGAMLKQFGGRITPDKAKALTIPVSDEAKGKTAYDFERTGKDLFVVSVKTGDPGTLGVLGYDKSTRKKGVYAFQPLFVLRTSAYQEPDPWFPMPNRILAIADAEAKRQEQKENQQWNSR